MATKVLALRASKLLAGMSFFKRQPTDEQSPESEQPTEDETLDEVEVRLHKAQYYRAVLDNDLFGGDESDVAAQVSSEFREFALTRLRVLLGIEQERVEPQPVELPFSEEQIEALQMWAEKLLNKPALLQQTSQQPQVTPVMSKVEVKSQPRFSSVPPPQPVVVTSKRPAAKTPPKKETIKSKSTAKTPKKVAKQEDLPPGVKVDENGEKYFEQEKEVVDQYGKVVKKTVKMSINDQVAPPINDPNYKPMPSPQMMQAVSQQMAQSGMGFAQGFGLGPEIQKFMNTGVNEVGPNDSGI